VGLVIGASSCTGGTITEYGQELKDNFVNSCTKAPPLSQKDARGNVAELASKSYCECVYTKMKDTYKLSFEDLKDFEAKVAKAKDGEFPPEPDQLQKSRADCDRGPAGPIGPAGPGQN